MAIIARNDVERYLARPDARHAIILIYGPDLGMVAERGAAITGRSVSDAADPFQILRLDGDDIAGDPLRLADEANAANLFGGRRAIRVRVGSRNLAPAVEMLARTPPLDAVVVLEAGDLKKTAPLRTLCEKSPNAAVIACYLDEPGDVRKLIDEALRTASLTIDADAKDALMAMLGGDRLATRGELDKLIAYAGGAKRLSLDDVEAIVGDAAASAMTQAIDGAYAGNAAEALQALAKLATEGVRPDAILAAALAHGWTLAQALAQVEAGQSPQAAAERAIPFFKRRAVFETQLGLWRRDGVAPIIRALGEAVRRARLHPDLSRSLADRTMLRIARGARRGR